MSNITGFSFLYSPANAVTNTTIPKQMLKYN